MANVNKLIMIGNLTRDPQLSYLPSQTPVVEFGLATNRRWTAQDGSQREDVCFIDCRCYGKSAETLNKYVRKGQQLYIEGRLQLDSWTTQDGQKRSKHRVFVESFQFLGGPSRDGQARDERPPAAASAGSGKQPDASQAEFGSDQSNEDDIPF